MTSMKVEFLINPHRSEVSIKPKYSKDEIIHIVFLIVRSASDKLYVMWTPPANQNIRVRHYILGWGKGIPDMYNQELEEKNRTFIIERLGTLKNFFH